MKYFFEGMVVGFASGLLIGLILAVAADNQRVKFCPECGAEYRNSAVYCTIDGTELRMRDKGE